MYNLELLSYIGLHIGHLAVIFIYTVLALHLYLTNKADVSQLISRMLIIIFYIALVWRSNYYDQVIFGIYLLLLASTLIILLPDHTSLHKVVMEIGALLIVANIIFYFVPTCIFCNELYESDVAFYTYITIVDILIIIISLAFVITILVKGNIQKRMHKIKVWTSFVIGLVMTMLITSQIGIVSHLWYGLYMQYVSVIVKIKKILRDDQADKIFIIGSIIALDDIVGYNLYPEYGYDFILNTIIWPLLFVVGVISHLFLARKCKVGN